MTEFQVGDKVEWCGVNGRVDGVDSGEPRVRAVFDSEVYYFYSNGKEYSWHKESSLKLISRAKRKVMMYPALVKSFNGFTVTADIYCNELSAGDCWGLKFVRWLNEEKFGVSVEVDE